MLYEKTRFMALLKSQITCESHANRMRNIHILKTNRTNLKKPLDGAQGIYYQIKSTT